MNEINRKGRFPVLFVKNHLLWRVKGRNSQLSRRTRVESLTLRKGPRKFKDKGDYCLLPMLEMVWRPV